MEIITIESRIGSVIVHDGRVKGSRLKWTAPGLEIYIIGKCPVPKRDMLNYHAMNQCIIRHIPVRSLVAHGWA